jgi:putative ATP-dependent endonuclease of OLD family
MFELIRGLPGQKLVSTHSPYVTQVADLFDVRAFTREGGSVACRTVPRQRADGSPTFDPEGLAKARRFVQKNNGEVLFARCVVMYEGDTEDGALPAFARHHWDADATVHGVSLINAQGAGNFKHFIVVLESLRIPWLVLVDGDQAGADGITGIENQIGRATTADEVFRIPGNEVFETNLLSEGFQLELARAIAVVHGPNALDDYRNTLHGQRKKAGAVRDYQSAGWEDRLFEDFCLGQMKSALGGAAIAAEINASVADRTQPGIPSAVQLVLHRASAIVGLVP